MKKVLATLLATLRNKLKLNRRNEMAAILGDEARDKVSGFIGIVVSVHRYLNGCDRLTLQPKIDKDGKLPACETFDDMQLEVLVAEAAEIDKADKVKTGGPEKYSDSSRSLGE